MVKTAQNTPTPLVTPAEVSPVLALLERLAVASERSAIALERIAQDATPLRGVEPVFDQPISARDVLSAGAAKLLESHVCQEWRSPEDNAAMRVCVTCGARTLGPSRSDAQAIPRAAVEAALARPEKTEAPAGGLAAADAGAGASPAPSTSQFTATAHETHGGRSGVPVQDDVQSGSTSGLSSPPGHAEKPPTSSPGTYTTPPDLKVLLPVEPEVAEEPSTHLGVELDAQIKLLERCVRALGKDMGGRVAMIGDETQDGQLATAVKAHAVALLTEPVFNAARARLGVKPGQIPSGATLRRFALEIVEPELARREADARRGREPLRPAERPPVSTASYAEGLV
jgi:hypothetical protein